MIRYRAELPKLVKELGLPLIGAELGVAEGYFANDLLTNGLEKLYMVDAWATLNVSGDGASPQSWHDKNMNDALKRVSKHGDKAVICRGLTTDMCHLVPDKSLGLLYLDAGHSYEAVMADLKAWFPKVVDGGIIAGHDYLSPQYGVFDAVRDFTAGRFQIYTIHENSKEDAGFMFINK
jgi:hypothetical protein